MRRLVLRFCSVLLVSIFAIISCWAQTAATTTTATVPPLIKVSGTLANAQGTFGVTFALYAEQTGGAPLWLETQNVTPDANGRYTIYLGANHANGVPLNLFASGEAQWLGVQPAGQAELPRAQLVSVPYALTAGDAQTLGGQPLSAFVLASSATTTTAGSSTTASGGSVGVVAMAGPLLGGGGSPTPVTTTNGATNYLAKFTTTGGTTSDIENSLISDTGAAVGIGTTTPSGLLDVENPTPATPQNVIFNTGGNLGIGTTAPQAALHVAGSVTPVGYVDVYSNTLNAVPFVNRAARGTLANPQPVTTNDIIGGFTGRGYYAAAGGLPAGFSGGRGSMIVKANEPWTALAQSTYVIFNTSPLGQAYQTERMRIDNAGNVGINTTTPHQSLEVNGSIMLTANSGAGVIFQDGSAQTTAFTGTNGGTYLAGTGLVLSGNTFSVNPTLFQAPVTGICPAGTFMTSITLGGGVNCSGIAGGPFATLGPNIFTGNQMVQGTIDASPSGTFATNAPYHAIHGESHAVGDQFSDPNTYDANIPSGVYGLSTDTTAGMYRSDGIRGEVFGPWGAGVAGVASDNPGTSSDSPTGVQGRVYSNVSGATGVMAKNLGVNPTATGAALNAEVLSSSGVAGYFTNDNGQNGTGNLIMGRVCNNSPGMPPVGGWPSWYACPSSNRATVFQVDNGGNIYTGGVRMWYPNSGQGTTQNLLAQLVPSAASPSSLLLATASTSTTNGIIGVVTGGAGNTGSATVAVEGGVRCQFDNAVVAGDLVQASTSNAGYCHDVGNTPGSGQVLGVVATTNTNSGQMNKIYLFGPASMLSASGSGGGSITGVAAGTGLLGGGTSGNVTLSADFTKVQPTFTGASCGANQFVTTVNSNGTVTCGNAGTVTPGALVLSSGGQVTGNVSIVPPATGAGIYAFSATQTQQGAAMPGSGGSVGGGAAPSGGGGGGGGPTAAWIATVPAAVVGTATDQSGNVEIGVFAQGTGPGDLALVATSTGTLPTMFVWNQNTSTTGSQDNNPSAFDAQLSAGVGKVIDAEATAAAGTDPTCNNCSELTVIQAEADAGSGTVNLFTGEANSPYANGIQLWFDTALTTNCSSGTQCPSVFDAGSPNGYFNIDGGFNVSTSGNISANGGNINGQLNADSVSINGNLWSNGGANFNNVNVTGSITASGGIATNNIGNIGGGSNTLTIQAGTVSLGGGLSMPSGGLTAGWATFSGVVQANGGLSVQGSFNAPNKSFKIDNPIDPANKYLYHSSIESSEMMNLYSGTVALDKRGGAWVQLPDWFEALNKDFRYQLTAIGAPGPNLYIAKEISGNRFRIAGGKPGMKVSWQVTGVRHDEWANAHRMQVEVEKTGKERGTYLYPELFPEKTAIAHKQ